jgi:hypothetical protein
MKTKQESIEPKQTYKIVKMGSEYTIFRISGIDEYQSRPIKYYKTKKGAMREIKRRIAKK